MERRAPYHSLGQRTLPGCRPCLVVKYDKWKEQERDPKRRRCLAVSIPVALPLR